MRIDWDMSWIFHWVSDGHHLSVSANGACPQMSFGDGSKPCTPGEPQNSW